MGSAFASSPTPSDSLVSPKSASGKTLWSLTDMCRVVTILSPTRPSRGRAGDTLPSCFSSRSVNEGLFDSTSQTHSHSVASLRAFASRLGSPGRAVCVAESGEEFVTGDWGHMPSGFLLSDTLSHTGVKSWGLIMRPSRRAARNVFSLQVRFYPLEALRV